MPLVEAFTALRHELKLQTKSARGVEESLQTALAGLDRAMERFGSVEPQETAAAEKAMRPLVEALIELDEALRRGARAVAASQQRLSEELPRRLVEDLEQRFARRSAWQRWRSRPWQAEVLQCCRQLVAETQGPLLASLGDGYQLICGRLQRMLAEHRIERLACAGQSVDPSQMRVIELVDAPGVPPETVVEEIRPGYVWRGRVVRYAEVRATRAAPQHPDGEDEEPAEKPARMPIGTIRSIGTKPLTKKNSGKERTLGMETIVGIDLGTTNSAISVVRDGCPVMLKTADGQAVLPSVVGLDSEGQLLVGQAARNQIILAPERTIKSVKRKMGQDVKLSLGTHQYTPQEISAIILRTLKEQAERALGHPVRKAVITVPAFFNETQREATRAAGDLADLDVVRIINEPTAATLVYEPKSDRNERLLVYDLGGGTFDVSIVQIEQGVIEVLVQPRRHAAGRRRF